MAKLKTFNAACHGGHTREIKYHQLIVIVGSDVHAFALHLDLQKGWAVSDPVSGYRLCDVPGSHRNAKAVPLKEARVLGQAAIEAILERIGQARFEYVLATARSKKA